MRDLFIFKSIIFAYEHTSSWIPFHWNFMVNFIILQHNFVKCGVIVIIIAIKILLWLLILWLSFTLFLFWMLFTIPNLVDWLIEIVLMWFYHILWYIWSYLQLWVLSWWCWWWQLVLIRSIVLFENSLLRLFGFSMYTTLRWLL